MKKRNFIFVIITIIFLLYIFPYIAFTKYFEYKNFKVYSIDTLHSNIENVIKKAELKLSRSDIDTAELDYNVFICDNYNLYSFLAFVNFGPAARHAAGFTSVGNNIYIAMTDVSSDLCFQTSDANRKRELSGLIAHEGTHNLVKEKLDTWGYIKLRMNDTWKNEGYAEYIAFDGEIDFKKETKFLDGKWNDTSGRVLYQKYRLAVTYLLKKYNLTFEELINNDYDFNKTLLEIKNIY